MRMRNRLIWLRTGICGGLQKVPRSKIINSVMYDLPSMGGIY
jgi:hypothetical protein